ncbi:MAG: hypothetical protein JWN48_1511 [Myxococcaceae bacterium]|nr:hypothetical protein [Myxococcaceae bacterium]
MQPLIESLFALLLADPERGLAPATLRAIEHADSASWDRALEELVPHKVFPLLSYRLGEHGLRQHVPERASALLKEVHDDVRSRNALLLLTLARILRLVASRGESVLLLKGILFADSYYPDFSTRPMSDIDLLAVRGRDEALFALLSEAGFRPSLHHTVQEHSITFMNREGVFCDAHRTLPMFVAEPWHRIRVDVELTRIRGVKVMALEPNAMVAHLVAHMHGHAPELGFVLLWIVDLALVLRRVGDQLELARVRKLVGSEGAWVLLLRLVRLLHGAGEPVHAGLLQASRSLPQLTVGAALRQRRITPWGLPAPVGWIRLLAHQLGLHHSERPLPILPDLVLWPLDEITDRLAPQIARIDPR